MNNDEKKPPDCIAFIADAHLGIPGEDPKRAEKLAEFLRWLQGKVSHVYIVGDLFDFWFEYKSVVPNIAPQVVFELYNLVQIGTEVILFSGNHDYWLGSYLRESVGVRIIHDEIIVEHQNKKIFIHHGDGFFSDDNAYPFIKKVLRNPVSIFLFRLLHPDFAAWIAQITSKTSRFFADPDYEKKNTERFRNIADKQLQEKYDAVVFGHSHVPLVENRENGMLVLLGDWINHSTYVLLENSEFSLHNW